jgi:hypothetical protein
VATLGDDEQYVIAAGNWTVEVRGTHFSVRRPRGGHELMVTVAEGTVAVSRPGAEGALLHAPARWQSGGGSSGDEEPAGEPRDEELPMPRGLAPAATEWPVLSVPALAQVDAWVIDGTRVGAIGELALRIPRGSHTLRAVAGRRTAEVEVELGDGGRASLSETDLATLQSRLAPAARGTVDRQALSRSLAAARPALKRCHETLMRRRPDLAGPYEIDVEATLAPSGTVRGVRVRSREAQVPDALAQCIETELGRRAFPRPTGGPVAFSLPLRFRPRSP